jgi:uncharacterized protein (UPF0210 family)
MSSLPTAPIRTLTLGVAEPHPLTPEVIRRASAILSVAQQRLRARGYEVQTLRLSTHPVFDDLADWSDKAILDYAQNLQKMLDEVALNFCSLGPAQLARPNFPLKRLALIPDLLASTSALNVTAQMATIEEGVRVEAALPIAQVILRLARETEEGFGNFRFAMLACVGPGCPFYPAAYHRGPTTLSVGFQGASIVGETLRALATESNRTAGGGIPSPALITERIRVALMSYASPVNLLVQDVAEEQGILFGGYDPSPAPMGEDSIVTAMEQAGYGPFGSVGTLTLAAALTAGLQSIPIAARGYRGLMLPVLEDAALGRCWAEGRVDVQTLLLYSAVCGTGLDTIPLSGDVPAEVIARLLLDVATLAHRLLKPLSARLFPVPGKHVGEMTAFTSPYLTNTLLRL